MSVFAFKNLNEDLFKSSSGGAFYQIIKLFFSKGEGCVYGVLLDKNLVVRYGRATRLEDCTPFQKSKYVKSDISNIYKSIISDLKSNKRVLFSGVPCQVFGLLKYLKFNGINHENLITIDLICNGAPSKKLWEEYVNWLEKKLNKKLVYFGFREKGDKMNPYLTIAKFSDGTVLRDHPFTACYNRLFLKKLIIPQGCFKCPFKTEERVSDITIADFWGANKIFKQKDLKRDVSLVITNSQMGDALFNIHNALFNGTFVIQCYNKDYLKYQHNLLGGTPIPSGYNVFWEDLNARGFNYILKQYADIHFPKILKYYLRRFYRTMKYFLLYAKF